MTQSWIMGKKLTSKTSACAVAANNWLWESLNYPPNRQHCSQIIVREALILKKPVKIVEILHYGGLPITDPTYKATVHTGMHTNNILWSICHAVCTVHFQVIWGSGKFGLKKGTGGDPPPPSELRNVNSFTRSKILERNFTPRKARK